MNVNLAEKTKEALKVLANEFTIEYKCNSDIDCDTCPFFDPIDNKCLCEEVAILSATILDNIGEI